MKTKTDRAYRGVDPSVLLKSVSVFWTVMGRESLKRWTPEEDAALVRRAVGRLADLADAG